ncbi:MAG: DUF2080 family transposase-associated protein [bacterium]|nr:DUF2080 family transposase-associated protein [bacterium]MDZ4227878.1 DUF2080 family transposase-associated protein [Candidatus Levybacteria bacterium]
MKEKKVIKQVTPFGNGGHISIAKRFIGRYMEVSPAHPIKELLTANEIDSIKKQVDEELDKKTLGFTHSLYKHSLKEYKDSLEDLDYADSMENLIAFLSKQKTKNKAIITKLRQLVPEDDED